MAYRVILKKRAEKELARLDQKVRTIIVGYLRTDLEGCENPRGLANSKNLEGIENGWRWRVGAYRILGIIRDTTISIEVLRIGHRRDIYRNLPK